MKIKHILQSMKDGLVNRSSQTVKLKKGWTYSLVNDDESSEVITIKRLGWRIIELTTNSTKYIQYVDKLIDKK